MLTVKGANNDSHTWVSECPGFMEHATHFKLLVSGSRLYLDWHAAPRHMNAKAIRYGGYGKFLPARTPIYRSF